MVEELVAVTVGSCLGACSQLWKLPEGSYLQRKDWKEKIRYALDKVLKKDLPTLKEKADLKALVVQKRHGVNKSRRSGKAQEVKVKQESNTAGATAKRDERIRKKQNALVHPRTLVKMQSLGSDPVYSMDALLQIVERCKQYKGTELEKRRITFGKAHCTDKRHYEIIFDLDIEKPFKKSAKGKNRNSLMAQKIKINAFSTREEAEVLLNRIMDDIEARLLGEDLLNLGNPPKLFKRKPCHLLADGDLCVDDISIIWCGTEQQELHMDFVSAKIPKKIRELMDKPSSMLGCEDSRIPNMKECIGPCSFECPLEETTHLWVADADDDTGTTVKMQKANVGEAFLFDGNTRHAGAAHAPRNRFRLHGHVEVKGAKRKKGDVDRVVCNMLPPSEDESEDGKQPAVDDPEDSSADKGPRKRTAGKNKQQSAGQRKRLKKRS